MTKKFDRQESENDRLQKELRELKAINRSLLKQVKKLTKGYYKHLADEEQNKEENIEEFVEHTVNKICWDCGTGEYKEIIVINRRWRQCQNCGKKGKVSILGKDGQAQKKKNK